MNFIKDAIIYTANTYPTWKKIYDIIGIILSVMVFHKAFYFVIGMFFTRKFKKLIIVLIKQQSYVEKKVLLFMKDLILFIKQKVMLYNFYLNK